MYFPSIKTAADKRTNLPRACELLTIARDTSKFLTLSLRMFCSAPASGEARSFGSFDRLLTVPGTPPRAPDPAPSSILRSERTTCPPGS